MVNQISDKDICPEEHRDEGPLFVFAGDQAWLPRATIRNRGLSLHSSSTPPSLPRTLEIHESVVTSHGSPP